MREEDEDMSELTPAAKAIADGVGQSIGRGLEVMAASLMAAADPGGRGTLTAAHQA